MRNIGDVLIHLANFLRKRYRERLHEQLFLKYFRVNLESLRLYAISCMLHSRLKNIFWNQ